LITSLEARGFKTEKVVETKPRTALKVGFHKHMIRMSHQGLTLKNVNDSRPELVIVNSYDASTSLQFKIGVFRLVCANGLVVGNNIFDYRINHVGDVQTKIKQAFELVLEKVPVVASEIEVMQSVTTTHAIQEHIIQAGLVAMDFDADKSLNLKDLFITRRNEDAVDSVWTFFNKIQENLIRYGIRYSSPDPVTGLMVKNRTRPIKSIDRQIKVNQALFNAAMESVR
jgi:hypothetical protein